MIQVNIITMFVMMFLILLSRQAGCSEKKPINDDPIVLLDGKPVRRSQLSNPVEREAPRKEPEVKVTVQVDGKAKCVQ